MCVCGGGGGFWGGGGGGGGGGFYSGVKCPREATYYSGHLLGDSPMEHSYVKMDCAHIYNPSN